MTKLVILGSSNAIPDPDHENTHFILAGQERTVLIDCVSNPTLRLQRAGVEYVDSLTDIILTHFHPDHVSGVPLLLMNMWLMGRKNALNIYGLHPTIDRLESMMDLYAWSEWPNFFPVVFYRLPEDEMIKVIACKEFEIHASPVCHLIPTIALRINHKLSGKVVVYSCDTEPCQQVVRLGKGADVLIHEASGEFRGHTSAAQAGDIARQANARKLVLIHYPTGKYASGDLIAEAKQFFSGPVELAEDFKVIKFD